MFLGQIAAQLSPGDFLQAGADSQCKPVFATGEGKLPSLAIIMKMSNKQHLMGKIAARDVLPLKFTELLRCFEFFKKLHLLLHLAMNKFLAGLLKLYNC